jgi:protein-S-isoprenylcysteine O-methyltransferase Ste14
MVGKNIVLTLVVAAAAAYVGWEKAPAVWRPLNIFGLCLASAAFVLWSVARFQLGKSFAVTAQARQLVTRGLYSKIRNPIYLFGSLFIAGYTLLLGRPRWLLIFVVVIPLQIWRARKEARVLEAKFGEEYRAYGAGTWL